MLVESPHLHLPLLSMADPRNLHPSQVWFVSGTRSTWVRLDANWGNCVSMPTVSFQRRSLHQCSSHGKPAAVTQENLSSNNRNAPVANHQAVNTTVDSPRVVDVTELNSNVAHDWSNTCRFGEHCELRDRGVCSKMHYEIDVAKALVLRDQSRKVPGSPRDPSTMLGD